MVGWFLSWDCVVFEVLYEFDIPCSWQGVHLGKEHIWQEDCEAFGKLSLGDVRHIKRSLAYVHNKFLCDNIPDI